LEYILRLTEFDVVQRLGLAPFCFALNASLPTQLPAEGLGREVIMTHLFRRGKNGGTGCGAVGYGVVFHGFRGDGQATELCTRS